MDPPAPDFLIDRGWQRKVQSEIGGDYGEDVSSRAGLGAGVGVGLLKEDVVVSFGQHPLGGLWVFDERIKGDEHAWVEQDAPFPEFLGSEPLDLDVGELAGFKPALEVGYELWTQIEQSLDRRLP